MKDLKIGLFGFGVVGEGIYNILNESVQIKNDIKRICIKDASKQRNAPANLFCTDKNDILKDPEINLVVELISESEAAYHIIKEAFEAGKSVVSANKKAIAEHLPVLLELAKKHNVSFLYEASSCASIPIIRNLEEYFDNDWLKGLHGIVNGCTNFILSQIKDKGIDYAAALKLAAENGFAEADPSLDVDGFDAAFKLSILCYHAFGIYVNAHEIFRIGITQISAFDAQYAKEKDMVIKLIAYAESNNEKGIELKVCPTFVPKNNTLASTNNEYNAVVVESAFSTEQVLSGKGAGRYPTASAVLSDISALSYDYKYAYKKAKHQYYKPTNVLNTERWYIGSSSNVTLDDNFEVLEKFSSGNNFYYIVKANSSAIKTLHSQNKISIIKLWDSAK